MSYTTGTTNFNLPQYVGTDKPSWTDTNQPFAELDTAVGGVTESVTTMGSRVTTLEGQVNDANTGILTRLSTAESDINTVEGEVASLNTSVTGLATELTDVKTDAEDMICAYKETSATSTHEYAAGDYFIYNDVLYKATQTINIGATIVPNTNCSATNVTSEIDAINTYLTDMLFVSFDNVYITGDISGNTDSNSLIPYPANVNQENIKDINIISLNPDSNENTQAYARNIIFESTGIRILLHTIGSVTQTYSIRYSVYYVKKSTNN